MATRTTQTRTVPNVGKAKPAIVLPRGIPKPKKAGGKKRM